MGNIHRYKFGFEKKKESGKEFQYMVLHPGPGSDPPIGSDQKSERDMGCHVLLPPLLYLHRFKTRAKLYA